jgi:hypothetical protein
VLPPSVLEKERDEATLGANGGSVEVLVAAEVLVAVVVEAVVVEAVGVEEEGADAAVWSGSGSECVSEGD